MNIDSAPSSSPVARRALPTFQAQKASPDEPVYRVAMSWPASVRASADVGIAVEHVALTTQAEQHAEDQRRLVSVRQGAGDGVDPEIDDPRCGPPVVGVVRNEERFAEQARGAEVGRRVGCRQTSALEPGDALAEPAL